MHASYWGVLLKHFIMFPAFQESGSGYCIRETQKLYASWVLTCGKNVVSSNLRNGIIPCPQFYLVIIASMIWSHLLRQENGLLIQILAQDTTSYLSNKKNKKIQHPTLYYLGRNSMPKPKALDTLVLWNHTVWWSEPRASLAELLKLNFLSGLSMAEP
jgi:hypothetical protein